MLQAVHQEVGSLDTADDITGRSRPLDVIHVVPLTAGRASRPFAALVVHNTAFERVTVEEAAVVEIMAHHTARVLASLIAHAGSESAISQAIAAQSYPTERSAPASPYRAPPTGSLAAEGEMQLPAQPSRTRVQSRFAREVSQDLTGGDRTDDEPPSPSTAAVGITLAHVTEPTTAEVDAVDADRDVVQPSVRIVESCEEE